jgi:SAM-dependent methyltransferase
MIQVIERGPQTAPGPECRICERRGPAREVFEQPERMFRCRYCGSVQVEQIPTPELLAAFYGRDYLDRYTAGMPAARFEREMPRRHAAKLRLVNRISHPRTLLDAGCGEGQFLALAQQAGWDCVGCDFGLRTAYPDGVVVKAGNLDQHLPFQDEMFDAVTNWAVIEHVRGPLQAVREMYRVLRPGGHLFLDTPLADDWCERLAAARSHWFGPPEHLHVLSALGLRTLVERAGFEVVWHAPYFERNAARFVARRLRNIFVGCCWGGALRVAAPRRWRRLRQEQVTPIGDIQLLVARRPARARREEAAGHA